MLQRKVKGKDEPLIIKHFLQSLFHIFITAYRAVES